MAVQTPDMAFSPVAGRPRVAWGRVVASGAVAVVVTTVVNVLIALALAGALQVPAAFAQLRPPAVVSVTIVGVVGATLVFGLLARIRPNPVRLFVRLAAAVLVVSWIPDVMLLVLHVPGATISAVFSLMSLHVVTAGISVLLLGRFGVRRSAGR